MKQHAGLTLERWAQFTRAQQILSIAAEMSRVRTAISGGHAVSVRNGYERVLGLLDLTVALSRERGQRRELLRWRGLVAEQYLTDSPDLALHADLTRCLLLQDREAARQVAFL